MEKLTLKYGRGSRTAEIPENWQGDTIESDYEFGTEGVDELVRKALGSPVATEPLSELVGPGEKVCIVFSDITRSWQRTDLYLPVIVEELERGGVRPEDILLLCALGTHRKHSDEELKALTGSLFGNYAIFDHDCDDRENLIPVGTTTRGTAVELNRRAVEADRLVLTGGIVFHLMAGYAGGRKSLVPGISSRRTIGENHSLSLHPEAGKGSHPLIGCDRIRDNPLHEDLMEAVEMVKPDFLVNIVPGLDGPGAAVAGHYDRAHREGCRLLRDFFLFPIKEKRDLVIASAGGFPGDINFYQSVKSMINACQALKPGGTLILATESGEGLGNPLMEEMIGDFTSMAEREEFLRKNYTIGRFIAYYGCELASRYRIFLVTDMEEPSLGQADLRTFRSLQDAVDAAAAETAPGEMASFSNLIDTDFDHLPLPGDHQWEYKDLLMLRNRVENAEIRLLALENMPFSFYDKIMMGQPGREEQLKHVQETIYNMGKAGIPVLGYGWTPNGVWRSSTTYRIRGGAQAMSADLRDFKDAPLTHDRVFTEEEMWEYYQYFLEGVIPVAEEAGITLAAHPNDPPVPTLGGVPQLLRSFEAYKKAMSMVESKNHGLQFCLGNFSEMGSDIHKVAEYFGKQDKLVYVHFQTVSNAITEENPRFNEVFVDMPGYYDPVAMIAKLKEVGFKGMIMPGHVPKIIGDISWEERGRSFTIGYIKGIMAALGIK